MASLGQLRNGILLAYGNNVINTEEFLLLFEAFQSRRVEIPYWNYERFNLDRLTTDECKAEFRFHKTDLLKLLEVLRLPDPIVCYNGLNVSAVEGLCILLKYFAYPCRHLDMVSRFGRHPSQICIIKNQVLDIVYALWHHLLTTLNQPWLSPANLKIFADSIHAKGGALQNCWGFIDGTVRGVCRPGVHQRTLYNGHKKIHSLKFQAIAAPNGLVANLFGPVEGRRHDSGMLADSGLLEKLQQHSFAPDGTLLCVYGDPAYPLRPHLQAPFKRAVLVLTPQQEAWNKSMSKVRVSVEWLFGDITNYFKFLDFKRNLKVGLSSVGKMYIVCVLLRNAHSCIYGSNTSEYFNLPPPDLEEYFV